MAYEDCINCKTGKLDLQKCLKCTDYWEHFVPIQVVRQEPDEDYCNECEKLTVTEKEQVNRKLLHVCTSLKRRILHGDEHPNLIRPSDCPKRKTLELSPHSLPDPEIIRPDPRAVGAFKELQAIHEMEENQRRNAVKKDDKWRCIICGTEVPEYEPQYCCSGLSNQCGCMGLPIDPCICSDECWDKLMGTKKQ